MRLRLEFLFYHPQGLLMVFAVRIRFCIVLGHVSLSLHGLHHIIALLAQRACAEQQLIGGQTQIVLPKNFLIAQAVAMVLAPVLVQPDFPLIAEHIV
ncbi:hypothetical protein A3F52_00115 [Candidatus Uhrbacteria bacterium RIFCSPHIGHO2_12_FULL_47_11]|nr:MAG: hypothetical protein A2753_03760 [Candidatus Uhrbacteria bacterium RIFCSPHIGHO2_01_FULL_47_11]OGL68630.1 MAG: hypothetical protein A3D58_01850 [Candidatus Uhrbacteria bacterium RIFCSPHIGHO2_02_FULL_46_47]OGL74713.1 MAG: hypothetical protein A3F52_00115 [Candidatus Uhrbacteria bacterium RIFCSPHIGHO2_12_FULL_47_11]